GSSTSHSFGPKSVPGDPAAGSWPEGSVVCSAESADVRGDSGGTADIALFRRVIVSGPARVWASPRLPVPAASPITVRGTSRGWPGRECAPPKGPVRGNCSPGRTITYRGAAFLSWARLATPDPAHHVLTWVHGGGVKCASSVNLRWPS